jgi:SAM-dependent methyltransferase
MGISTESAEFLVGARRAGVVFGRVLTLGRQEMWVSPGQVEGLLRSAGLWREGEAAEAFRRAYAEPQDRFEAFIRHLGAMGLVACDASAYEGAQLIHDLNCPIDELQAGQFDTVIDGGTLEHVFNFPVAIANCMRWLRVGGHFLAMTPANNYCGHGFYQFSPELWYRVLAEENGFQVDRMLASELSSGITRFLGLSYPFEERGPWYEVEDPARVQERICLVNSKPVLLHVLARKMAEVVPFRAAPQQSDYVEQWTKGRELKGSAGGGLGWRLGQWLRRRLPERVARDFLPRCIGWLDPWRARRFHRGLGFRNRRHYIPVDRSGGEGPARE